jgi:hypothetical protein
MKSDVRVIKRDRQRQTETDRDRQRQTETVSGMTGKWKARY